MATYEIRVSATADIVEVWHVGAESEEEARRLFDDQEHETVTFIANVDIDGERDREILSCELTEALTSEPSMDQRLASLRAAGLYVAPDGGFPSADRWKGTERRANGSTRCICYAPTEAEAVKACEEYAA